jgi:hypothetical protein
MPSCPPSSHRTRRRTLALLLLVATIGPVVAGLTDRYVFEVPREGTTRFEGVFDLALGSVRIGEARPGMVFQAEVTIAEDQLRPDLRLDRANRYTNVRLGFESGSARQGVSLRGFRQRHRNEWLLYFDRETPLDLRFDLGLADADLDLSGFRVERLSLSAGMATTRLAFDRPNPVEMTDLRVDAGASRFRGEGLGNARFRRMVFNGGAGSYSLDFSGGPLPAGARADIDVGVSRVHLRLPEGHPVVLEAPESWLARIKVPAGYVNQGRGIWHSPEVRNPARAFHVRVNVGVGRVTCDVGSEV